MHYLHPRSRSTSTLFTSTLALCFLIVGLPHLLPCPVDRRQFADSYETSDGKVRRRRKRNELATSDDMVQSQAETADVGLRDDGRPKRECPVPKPRGIVGQIMGFTSEEQQKPSEIVIQSLDTRKTRPTPQQSNEGT